MTPSDILTIIGLALLGGGLATLGLILFERYQPSRAQLREPRDPEPPSPGLRTAAAAWSVRLLQLRDMVRRQPVHEGATEQWSPGAQLATVGQSPDLEPVLTEVQMIAEVHAMFDRMMADFRFDLDHIVDGACLRIDPEWRRRDADTTGLDLAALRELLDAEDAGLVTA